MNRWKNMGDLPEQWVGQLVGTSSTDCFMDRIGGLHDSISKTEHLERVPQKIDLFHQ